MKRNINRLAEKEYDVLVVGGGIYGAATVREAAQRGLKAAIIDSRDFCGATSANSLKIIHGGLRYLQQMDVVRVLESCHERRNLMRIAPHVVHPLPCIMPTRPRAMKSRPAMLAAMLLYDIITYGRNSLSDSEKHIPGGKVVSRSEALRILSGLSGDGISGGAIWSDAYANSTERLCVSMVRSATDAGAEAANYVKLTGFLRSGNTVTGIKAKDMLSGNDFEIQAKLVILNTGPWTNEVLARLDCATTKPIRGLALGMNIIVDKPLFRDYAVGLSCPKTVDAGERLLFFMPWRERTMIGTYYRTHNDAPDKLKVTDEDIERYLVDINSAHRSANVTPDHITLTHAGLLPLREACPDQRDPALSNHPTTIDHAKADHVEGLLSVVGVKYTTARDVAEKTITLALKKLRRDAVPSVSAETPLPGGDIVDYNGLMAHAEQHQIPGHLIENYGSDTAAIMADAHGPEEILQAELNYLMKEEMPQTLSDVLFRRTALASSGIPDESVLIRIATIMSSALGWDEKRMHAEVRQVASLRFPGAEGFDGISS